MAYQVRLDLKYEKMFLANKVNFRYFIFLAMQNKMSWEGVGFVLDDLASTLSKSKEVIQVLLKELQLMHSKNQKNHIEAETMNTETENAIIEEDSIDQTSTENGFETDNNVPEFIDVNDFHENSEEITEINIDVQDQPKYSDYVADPEINFEAESLDDDTSSEGENFSEGIEKEDESQKISINMPEINSQIVEEVVETNGKSFECETCHKTFNLARNLKRHMKRHKPEKKFQCKTCNKCLQLMAVKNGFNPCSCRI